MITGHCIDCWGTGIIMKKDWIGVARGTPCFTCKGLGGIIMKEGSGEHRVAAAMGTMRKNYEPER